MTAANATRITYIADIIDHGTPPAIMSRYHGADRDEVLAQAMRHYDGMTDNARLLVEQFTKAPNERWLLLKGSTYDLSIYPCYELGAK